jgi:hypothetical protein
MQFSARVTVRPKPAEKLPIARPRTPASHGRSMASPDCAARPSIAISGPRGFVSPVNAVCVSASTINRSAVIAGSDSEGVIVNHPSAGTGGGMRKTILHGPGVQCPFASSIAARNDPGPASAVEVTPIIR